jgi:hypothetical protein
MALRLPPSPSDRTSSANDEPRCMHVFLGQGIGFAREPVECTADERRGQAIISAIQEVQYVQDGAVFKRPTSADLGSSENHVRVRAHSSQNLPSGQRLVLGSVQAVPRARGSCGAVRTDECASVRPEQARPWNALQMSVFPSRVETCPRGERVFARRHPHPFPVAPPRASCGADGHESSRTQKRSHSRDSRAAEGTMRWNDHRGDLIAAQRL